MSDFEPDAIVVGAGLAGLVATHEATQAGKRVLVLDQENRANLGGQAWWSLGGLFFVDSPEQRRMGIKDSRDLAWQDWQGSAGFDRVEDQPDGTPGEDHWARQWAEAYVDFAAGEKRSYLRDLGLRSLPFVGWAERGRGDASGHGNSVPRFHLTWGTGPEVVRIFLEPVLAAEEQGLVQFGFRHRVDSLITESGAVAGVRGATTTRSAWPATTSVDVSRARRSTLPFAVCGSSSRTTTRPGIMWRGRNLAMSCLIISANTSRSALLDWCPMSMPYPPDSFVEDLRLLNWKVAWSASQGRLDPAEASAMKVFGSEFFIEAYQQLMEDFAITQDELSKRIGRSRPQISNTIRLSLMARRREVAVGLDHQDHPVGERGELGRVGEAEDRRAVDHDEVVVAVELLEQRGHRPRSDAGQHRQPKKCRHMEASTCVEIKCYVGIFERTALHDPAKAIELSDLHKTESLSCNE